MAGLLLVACTRDENPTNKPQSPSVKPIEKPTLLKNAVIKTGNGEGKTEFIYNGDKIQEINSSLTDRGNTKTSKAQFQYTGDQITTITEGDENIKLTYNPNGTLKNSTKHNSKNGNLVVSDYTYNGNTITIKKTHSNTQHPNNASTQKNITVTLNNGNIVKIVNPEENTTEEYEYDNHKNPFANVKGLTAIDIALRLNDTFGSGELTAKNNITKYTIIQKIPFNNYIYTHTTNYTYEYNSDGYPIKAIITHGTKKTEIVLFSY